MSKRRRRHGKKRHHRKANPAHHVRRRRRHNPARVHARRRHHRRKNPGGPIADILLAVGVGALAAVASKVIAKEAATVLPSTTPSQVISIAKIALGVGGAILLRKHPAIAAGVAVGAGAPAALELATPLLPTSLQAIGFEGVLDTPRLPGPRADMGAIEFALQGYGG